MCPCFSPVSGNYREEFVNKQCQCLLVSGNCRQAFASRHLHCIIHQQIIWTSYNYVVSYTVATYCSNSSLTTLPCVLLHEVKFSPAIHQKQLHPTELPPVSVRQIRLTLLLGFRGVKNSIYCNNPKYSHLGLQAFRGVAQVFQRLMHSFANLPSVMSPIIFPCR